MEKLNWEFMMKVLPLYREALWLTLRLGLCGTALATAVGLLCAAIQYEKVPVLRQIVAGYIELSRNTPLLIQLFFYLLRPAQNRDKDRPGGMRRGGVGVPGRQLYGGGLSQRAGSH